GLLNDEELESNFRYEMPPEVREQFVNSNEVYFDITKTYTESIRSGESSKVVLERSIEHHAKICTENSEDVYDALILMKLLDDDIDHRIHRYTKCISKSTFNFVEWLKDDYKRKLRSYLRGNFDNIFETIHGRLPE
ncbi:MAG: DEAD/DEAH box helicase, partial [Chlorobi bacterium]|nr:DEAD/DEAH box helicase [Chlorobiota bacterium]